MLSGVLRANAARNDQWWTTASPQDVVQAYATARSWEHVDPQAAQAAAQIRIEARARYAIELDNAPVDTAAMDATFAAGQMLERQAATQRQLEREDLVQAQVLTAQAERAERAAEETRRSDDRTVDDVLTAVGLDVAVGAPAGDQGSDEEREPEVAQARVVAAAAYDSAERRATFAAGLEARGIDRELVATRLRADVSNAKPASEAARATTRAAATGAEQSAARRRRVQRTHTR